MQPRAKAAIGVGARSPISPVMQAVASQMSVSGPAGCPAQDLGRVPVAVPGDYGGQRLGQAGHRVAPVDEDEPVLGRLDQHVLGKHRAVDDAGPVRDAERDQQPPPHPRGVARIDPAGEGRPHVGEAGESVERARSGCRAARCRFAESCTPLRLHEPREVRQQNRSARRAGGCWSARSASRSIRSLSAGSRGDLEQPAARPVQVGEVAALATRGPRARLVPLPQGGQLARTHRPRGRRRAWRPGG